MDAFELIRSHALLLPNLAKFAAALALIVAVPPLCRRVGIPSVVGLLLGGIVIGPHGLDMLGTNRPIADFLAEIGKLLLMFVAGLEIDMRSFAGSEPAHCVSVSSLPFCLCFSERARGCSLATA